jgi:exosome complex RNA-binding protein Rrp42 (RNase PH superfamily)
MSTTQSGTQYYIQGSINGPSGFDAFQMVLTNASDQTDASVLALIEAMQNVAWPTGVTCSAQVDKIEQTTVSYNADMTAVPPTFS